MEEIKLVKLKRALLYKKKGFSLLELLAVISIVGILAAIVIPGFSDYIRDARRNDGITFLLEVIQRQERYFSEELTYTPDLTNLGYALSGGVESPNGFYTVTADVCVGETTFSRCISLSAVPIGVQAGDVALTLNSRGQRTPANAWP